MQSNFDKCLSFTLTEEGGYSNNPYDKGGATNYGIIQRVYNSYKRNKGETPQDVRQISHEEVSDIYRSLYWDKVWGDKLPSGVDLSVFDFGVNSGPAKAISSLQKTINSFANRTIAVDGNIGPATLDALTDIEDMKGFVKAYNDSRLSFLHRLSDWRYFGAGWGRRVNEVQAVASTMAEDKPHVVPEKQKAPEDVGPAADAPPSSTPSPSATLSIGVILTSVATGVSGQLSNPFALAALVVVIAVALYVAHKKLA